MSYTSSERESIFICNDEDMTWEIYSLQPRIITKLRKANIMPYRVDEDGAHYYKGVKFNQISARAESTRVMSQAQKDAGALRLSNAREAKKNNVQPN